MQSWLIFEMLCGWGYFVATMLHYFHLLHPKCKTSWLKQTKMGDVTGTCHLKYMEKKRMKDANIKPLVNKSYNSNHTRAQPKQNGVKYP